MHQIALNPDPCKKDGLCAPATNSVYGALALGHPIPKFNNWIERNPARGQWL